MTRRSLALRLAGTAAAGLLVAALASAPGSAQPADPSVQAAKPNQGNTSRPARKPTKPVARAAAQTAAAKEWTIENALPDHSPSLRQYDLPAQPKIGRVPLESGSVGFETETKTNAYRTPDGRTIPGLEAAENRPSSYVGLSVSMPTSDKMMNLPVPLVPLIPPPQ